MTTRRPPRFFPQPFDCKRRTHLVAVGAIACIALTACASGSGPFAKHSSPYAPTALKRGEEAVDGLTVGHRLTAAGEHELALKAYLRAASEQGITVDVLSAIGSTNLQLGRLGQAERILRKATEMDGSFVPAWNNLGVVLMETGQIAEAARVFQIAFGLDRGQSAQIRDNLRLALAKTENPDYDQTHNDAFALVRRGTGDYLLLSQI
ncbi:tetratricopeptide repeat protein [Aliiroseovarius sp. F47248L]|uniref:tetratricopeptide repeat protein n=1 Tax=Aliiroseovarius sp. F47248L TaxID=2926420 RepID=UPI001FF2267B|nr:tetratricopeptide repeat protein [Aliiroseovarius sp. F47248L]MCK0138318.1 tetratricopeptide repeat protein [Aliiroseovarius sp. F47248L]